MILPAGGLRWAYASDFPPGLGLCSPCCLLGLCQRRACTFPPLRRGHSMHATPAGLPPRPHAELHPGHTRSRPPPPPADHMRGVLRPGLQRRFRHLHHRNGLSILPECGARRARQPAAGEGGRSAGCKLSALPWHADAAVCPAAAAGQACLLACQACRAYCEGRRRSMLAPALPHATPPPHHRQDVVEPQLGHLMLYSLCIAVFGEPPPWWGSFGAAAAICPDLPASSTPPPCPYSPALPAVPALRGPPTRRPPHPPRCRAGVFMLVPVRRILILEHELPYPSGTATGACLPAWQPGLREGCRGTRMTACLSFLLSLLASAALTCRCPLPLMPHRFPRAQA